MKKNYFFSKNNDERYLFIASLILFIFSLTTTLIITFCSYKFWLNSDMTAEIIGAQEALKEGGLLSKNWYYGTELRLMTPTLIYEFLLLFTNNFFVIRCITIPLVLTIYLLSIYFLAKELKYKKYYFFIASLMLLPLSINSSYYAYVVSGYQMYAFYISLMFVTIALAIKSINTENLVLKSIFIILICFIAILLGLNSPRHLLLQYIPLFLGFLLLFFINLINKKKIAATNSGSYLFIFGAALCCNILSTIFYKTVLSKEFHVFSYSLTIKWPTFPIFKSTFTQLFHCFGLNNTVSFFGILSNITFVLCLLFIIIYLIFLIIFYKNLSEEEKGFSIYCYISLIIPILFFLFVRNEAKDSYILIHQQYFLLSLVNFFFLMPIILNKLCIKRISLSKNKIIKYAFVSSFAFISMFSFNKYYIPFKNNQDIYNVANILNKYNYKKGYASHWNGSIMNEIVNNKPEMYVFKINLDTIVENKEVQSTRHDDFIIKEECFAIFSNEETLCGSYERAKKDPRSKLLGKTNNYYIFGLETGTVLFKSN